ncbi:MAG: HAD hydrolase-like protein [Bdellovibrionaceae bacterium]|nr:HAD hydrolase-like protein [Pseudobdellovibrionaceae bacterium]
MCFKDFIKDYDVVIWDWNGTLLDDLTYTHKVIARILVEEGLEAITVDEYRQHFGFPVSRYYAALGLPSQGPDFDRVAQKYITGFHSYDSQMTLFEDSLELLEAAKALNVNQYVLSAANIEHLESQLQAFNIRHYFNDISGASDIYARGKIEQAQRMKPYLQERGYKKGVYVGDTDHDYEVSQVLGYDFCFSAKGHQPIEKLKDHKISYILRG